MDFLPSDAVYDEAYWQAVMQEGEHCVGSAPPATPETIWLGLNLEWEKPEFEQLASSEQGWQSAFDAMEKATVLELSVTGYNRGGLLVEWEGRQGFIPVSHLGDFPTSLDEGQREQELQDRVGRVMCLRIIEVDPDRSRLVLSERATHLEENQRRELLESLKPGNTRQGRVTNICSFGAFVDLGGLEGLIHISEISWRRVDHPSEILHSGQEVAVRILNVDRERGRVGLSLKQTQPDPWDDIENRYREGQVVEGVVTNVVDFGAFVEVEKGLEGLIHVSELAEGSFLHPRNVVQEGQTVQLRVITVDGNRRRLGLSLRQMARNPDRSIDPGG